MKKILIGGFLFVSGVLLYIGIHISTVIFMTEVKGWSTPPGRFGTALEQVGGKAEFIVALLLCIIGIGFMAWDGGKTFLQERKKQTREDEKPEDEKLLV